MKTVQTGTAMFMAAKAQSVPAFGATYDNTTSGLTADNLQAAIDELQAEIDALPIPASAGQVPTVIHSAETFAVADDRQAPYTTPFVIEAGGVLSIGVNARFPEVN